MDRQHWRWRIALGLFAFLVGLLPACASSQGSYIWVDELKEPDRSPAQAEYLIGVGDLLNIQVWDQEKMSARMRVRSDGRISLPFLNDVEAAGKTPVRLSQELEGGFKSVVINPKVTVVVEEPRPLSVSILGEVGKPGLHTVDPGAGVAQALAAAGGLNVFAHKDRIFVVRSVPQPTRIRFTYEALTRTLGQAPYFQLRTGDVIVVE